MQIKTIQVKNLRSLRDVYLTTAPLTALIGGNNAGKSTILKAIEFFFEAAPKLDREDFSVGGENEPIEITLGFDNLTPNEVAEFGSAVIKGELIVTRQFSLGDKESGQYSAKALVYPKFGEIRDETDGTKKRVLYNKIAEGLEGLDPVKNFKEVESALGHWEKKNPGEHVPKRIRGFFGAPNVANGKLRKKTGVHLVPAVRDATAETGDPKRSPIITLLTDIAKQTLENRKEMAEFIERTQEEFSKLSDPDRVPELAEISDLLTTSLQQFYSDSKLEAHWEQGDGVSLTYPTPRLKVENSGVITDLSRVGHGLQRAALFSVVQFLAEQRHADDGEDVDNEFEEAASDIIILIEEPEIYQHPSKQLVIFDAFKKIADGFNKSTGIRVQIIYSTHSEKFVRMSDFDIARIVKRTTDKGDLKTTVSGLTIESCSKAFAEFFDPPKKPMSNAAFAAKLHIFTREVCEGFFASKIILVEGGTDQAVLEAAYLIRDRNIHQESIAIISMGGKTNMDKPAYVFPNLGIPTYLLFDNDKDEKEKKQKPETNILLQKICGVENPVEWPDETAKNFAAINGNLEKYLRSRLGDQYDKIFDEVAAHYGLSPSEIKKTPAATSAVFRIAQNRDVTFPLFDAIIEKVDAL